MRPSVLAEPGDAGGIDAPDQFAIDQGGGPERAIAETIHRFHDGVAGMVAVDRDAVVPGEVIDDVFAAQRLAGLGLSLIHI